MRAPSRIGHDEHVDAPRALADARAALAAAAAALAAAGARPEQLASTVAARRALGFIPVREKLRRTGEGYLLGALLVTVDGDVFEPGRIVRASRQVLPGHQSASAQERRALRELALDSGFGEGETLVLDSRPIPLDDPEAMRAERGPLMLRESTSDDAAPTVLVRWIPSAPDAALRPLAAYLDERVDLVRGALIAARAESEHPRQTQQPARPLQSTPPPQASTPPPQASTPTPSPSTPSSSSTSPKSGGSPTSPGTTRT